MKNAMKSKPEKIDTFKWAKLFIKVYGDQSIIAILYWIATIFRKEILQHTYFPILFLHGSKCTGKSILMNSLQALYGKYIPPYELNSSQTPKQVYADLATFDNLLLKFDSYTNSITPGYVELFKSIINGGNTYYDDEHGLLKSKPINNSVIISGQDKPCTDIAFDSKLIILSLTKSRFSDKQRDNLQKLIDIERPGLSHLSDELRERKDLFEKQFPKHFEKEFKNLQIIFEDYFIDLLTLKSAAILFAAFKSVQSYILLPFNTAVVNQAITNYILRQEEN